MKKSIYTTFFALLAVALIACNTTTSRWSIDQRRSINRALNQYRDMVYLDELTDAEFYIFSGNVADELELSYPDYNVIAEMPAIDDTIQVVVTTLIVEQLDADGANIRHIYPYRELRREGRLPRSLTRKEQRSFYKCLARKINAEYESFGAFFNAILADTTDKSEISSMQAECAKSLFDWSNESESNPKSKTTKK